MKEDAYGMVTTSIRLSPEVVEKWGALAKELGVTRNRAFGMILDAAKVHSAPSVSVEVKANRHDAKVSKADSVTAVEA